MSDYFRDIDPKGTTVLEDLGGQRVPRNRYNTRVIYHDPILARASISARLSGKRHFEAATELVNLLESRARLILGWEMSAAKRNWYTALVARYISRSPRLVSEYTTLLRSSGARLVIAEEACYGNAMVCLIAAARSLGIPTAEMQHGMVTSGHDAYALAPSLAASLTYKNMLPDYFLSYGKWWNTQLQVPVTPIEIGNPHGDTKRANAEREKAVLLEGRHRICSDIIILGDGIDSKIYIEFAIKLASLLPDRQVIIRPHPQEKKYFKAAHPTDRIGSVKVDTNADIYTSLSTAHAVVSEMSTGLFEAIGLANRVFMWATPKAKFYLPKHPFEEFSDVFHLAQALTAPPPKNKDWTVNDIWAPNWQANYQKFVQEVIK